MRRREAEKWLRETQFTLKGAVDLIEATPKKGTSKVNKALSKERFLEVRKADLMALIDLHGPNTDCMAARDHEPYLGVDILIECGYPHE